MNSFLKAANKVKIDPALMEDVLKAVDQLPPDRRDFVGTTIQIAERVKKLGLPEREHLDMSMAINFRLMAMAHLMNEGGGRGWTAPSGEGCTFVHEELVRAAAEEPMIEVDDEVTFNFDSFHNRLLALAEMHGEA